MMSIRSVGRTVVGVCVFATLLALPSASFAQSSVFTAPVERVGDPGTQQVSMLDPETGLAELVTVSTGAFVNPCTLENVDVTGSSTISTLLSMDRFGRRKLDVSVSSKGTGMGWTGTSYATATFSGSTYLYSDSQQFTFRLPPADGTSEEFVSDFTDRFSLKGARSVDNWTVRAHFKIRVSAAGDVQVFLIKTTRDDGCKG